MSESTDELGRTSDADSPSTLSDPYESLKEAIFVGELKPGHHLVEATLAQTFSVSRTPIREALTRLEQDGMVVRTRLGLTVRERTPGEILDIYEVRILLEGAAARAACERRTNNDVLVLQQAHRRYLAAKDSGAAELARANRRFHHTIWDAAHQPALKDSLQRIEMHLGRYPITTLSWPGRWENSIGQHEALATAIDERDGDRAAEIATQHFVEAREIRVAIWADEF